MTPEEIATVRENIRIALYAAVRAGIVSTTGDGRFRLTALGRRIGSGVARCDGVDPDHLAHHDLVAYATGLHRAGDRKPL